MLHALIEELPPIVQRRRVAELTYGLVNARTLANLDCKGLGPENRMKLAGRVIYTKAALQYGSLVKFNSVMETIIQTRNKKRRRSSEKSYQ